MQECHLITTAAAAEDLSAALSDLGAHAVTWQDAGNQAIYEPKPEEELHWDEIKLVALFDDESLAPEVHAFLQYHQQQKLIISYQFVSVEDQDWVRASLDLFLPTPFGERLWICPSWHQPPDANAVNVIFDPGLAFGTGSHPTTALCLEWLSSHIKGNERVVDYGCGSGILAISALMLGAAHALAIDYDPQAVQATLMNAELNKLNAARLTAALPDPAHSDQTDIVLANIISKPLIELAETICGFAKPNAAVVLSGLLSEQEAEVRAAYAPWCEFVERAQQDEWIRLVLKRK